MKKRTYLLASILFTCGVIMLLGSSYSLITNNLTSNETYGFDIANFNVSFSDSTSVSLLGIPTKDEEGLNNSKEITFKVKNDSDYDVNYRLDIIEKSISHMANVIRYSYSLNNDPYTSVIALSDDYTIMQNRILKVNEVDNYKIKIWLSIDADEAYMNKEFQASISLTATLEESKYASSVIKSLAEKNLDNVIKLDNEYRYSNYDSANYLWFNCKDGFTKGEDYCEKWRIIGSFKNKWENSRDEYYSLKIMRNTPYEEVSFNNEELRGDYNNSYINTFANGAYYDLLNDDYKNYILKAKWYIGNSNSLNFMESYEMEKNKVYYNYIGLINVSDYLYLESSWNSDLKNILTINKNIDEVNVIKNGIITMNNLSIVKFIPCVYLKPDISILSGTGTIDNPYEIGVKYPMNYGNN